MGTSSAAAAVAGRARPPRLGIRWWRLVAGVCLGLACASKWNGIWYVPAFAALTLAWDIGARRAAGFGGRRSARVVARDAGGLVGALAVVPVAVYLATWSGWFATGGGYRRPRGGPAGIPPPLIPRVVSLFRVPQ